MKVDSAKGKGESESGNNTVRGQQKTLIKTLIETLIETLVETCDDQVSTRVATRVSIRVSIRVAIRFATLNRSRTFQGCEIAIETLFATLITTIERLPPQGCEYYDL